MSDCLLVLVHGLWGNPEHLWCVKEAVEKAHPDVHILVCGSSQGNRTYDGVDVLGERIAVEIRAEIARLQKEDDDVKIAKISFVGYSLGGLAARFAIGVLYDDGFFNEVKPVSYTTFATPHLGVSPTSRGILAWLVSNIGPRSLSITGSHIFLTDAMMSRRMRRPLLEIMTEPGSAFVKGLSLFASRNCYANIANDRSVPYFSAAISSTDPYRQLDKLRLRHLEKYGDVVLDPSEPYVAVGDGEVGDRYEYKLSAREMTFRIVMLAGLPLWLLIFSVNAVVANFKSGRRISAHRSEHPDRADVLYAARAQELVEETLEAAEYDGEARDVPPTSSDGEGISSNGGFRVNDTQARIATNLNKLPWYKVPVHIRKTQHSHAAIICRSPDTPRLVEGHVVLQHWLDHVKLF